MNFMQQVQAKTGHDFPYLQRLRWFRMRMATVPAVPANGTVPSNGTQAPAVTQADVEVAAEAAEAAMTAETITSLDEMEAEQKAEIATHTVKKPQHVGGYTSWDGKYSKVWYYPSVELYGVEVTFNTSLSTGPRFSRLSEAHAYAQESTRT